ncbi:hypothetical protein VTN77DRAFT_5089 [Rasamsonia byssochlamydoides]|uniref:uncharacterized protein n=1 Tax=Rasamsonia byssochlamydoides TaxID=89139 RepID=UPI0037426A8F
MGEAPHYQEHLLILLPAPVPEDTLDDLRKTFPNIEITHLQISLTDTIDVIPSEILKKTTILATSFRHIPTPQQVPNLKLLHSFSAGVDHLLKEPIVTDTNVPITTSSGIHGPPIAEWTVMNWLVASKQYNELYEAQKKHEWKKWSSFRTSVEDHVGKRVGILGYGSIGRQIGRVAVALGMEVLAYTASPRDTPESRRDNGYIVPGTGDPDGTLPISWHHGTDKASLRKFLALGLDHVVVSLPLTPATTHLLGAEEFAILSSHSPRKSRKPFITNISRGKIIDQDALIAALKNGELSGAALDVTDPEPLPADNPLWDAPNVQISPHISGLGIEYFVRALNVLKVNLGRLERGEPLINEFKRKRGY